MRAAVDYCSPRLPIWQSFASVIRCLISFCSFSQSGASGLLEGEGVVSRRGNCGRMEQGGEEGINSFFFKTLIYLISSNIYCFEDMLLLKIVWLSGISQILDETFA